MLGISVAVAAICIQGIICYGGIEGSEIPHEVYKQQAFSDIISNYYAYDPFNRHGREYVPSHPYKPLPPYPNKPYEYKKSEEYYDGRKPLSYDELKSFYAADDYHKAPKYVQAYEVVRGSKNYQPPVYIPEYPIKPTKYRKGRVDYAAYERTTKPYGYEEYRNEEPYYHRYAKAYDYAISQYARY